MELLQEQDYLNKTLRALLPQLAVASKEYVGKVAIEDDTVFALQHGLNSTTRNILDCDQSNVLLAHLFDSPRGVSYRWSVVTIHLSGTVNEIFSFEDN